MPQNADLTTGPHLGDQLKQNPLKTAGALLGGLAAPFQNIADPSQSASLGQTFNDMSYFVPGVAVAPTAKNVLEGWKGSDLWEKALMGLGLAGAIAGVNELRTGALAARFRPPEGEVTASTFATGSAAEPVSFGNAIETVAAQPRANLNAARNAEGSLMGSQAWEMTKQAAAEQELIGSDYTAKLVMGAQNTNELAEAMLDGVTKQMKKAGTKFKISIRDQNPARVDHFAAQLNAIGDLLVKKHPMWYTGNGLDIESQKLLAAKNASYRLLNLIDNDVFGKATKRLRTGLRAWANGKAEESLMYSKLAMAAEEDLMGHGIYVDNRPEPGQTLHMKAATDGTTSTLIGDGIMPTERYVSTKSGESVDTNALMAQERKIDPDTLVPELASGAFLQLAVSLGLTSAEQGAQDLIFYAKFNSMLRTIAEEVAPQYDVPTLSAAFSQLSGQTKWAPDNVVGGLHLVLQAGRQDLKLGSPEYVKTIVDVIRKSGWADDVGLDRPGFKESILRDIRFALAQQQGDRSSLLGGGIKLTSDNVTKAFRSLNGELPEAERLLTLKYMTFGYLGVNPFDKMFATIDTHVASYTRGIKPEKFKPNEFLQRKIKKGGETFDYGPSGEVSLREGLGVAHDTSLKTWEAQQKAHRLVTQYLLDHPESPVTQELNRRLNDPAIEKFLGDNTDITPNVIQAGAWAEWARSLQAGGGMRGTPRRVLMGSYTRTMQGNHPINKGALDAVAATNPELALPPAGLRSAIEGDAVRARGAVIVHDKAGHVWRDQQVAPIFNGMHDAHYAYAGFVQQIPNTPHLVQSVDDLVKHLGDAGEVRRAVANPNMVDYDPHVVQSQVSTFEFESLDALEKFKQAHPEYPVTWHQTQMSAGPTYAGTEMPDLSRAKRLTNKQLASMLSDNDWVAISAEGGDRTHAQLLAEISKQEGVQVAPGYGVYGGSSENTVLAFGVSPEEAVRLGVKYGQESVATRVGLIYTTGKNAGMMQPANMEGLKVGQALSGVDHTKVQLPNDQTLIFVMDYGKFGEGLVPHGDLEMLSGQAISNGGARFQLHADFGLKPQWEWIDVANRAGVRDPNVLSVQQHVSADMYRTPGTMPVYDRISYDGAGQKVAVRSKTATGAANEYQVDVPRLEWARVPDKTVGRSVKQLGQDSVMYDHRIAVTFETGIPDKLPRNPLSSRGSRWAIIKPGEQPVMHLLKEEPAGHTATPGSVLVRAYRGKVMDAEFLRPADWEQAAQVLDDLGVTIADSTTDSVAKAVNSYGLSEDQLAGQEATAIERTKQYSPKSKRLENGMKLKLPVGVTPKDVELSARTGGHVKFRLDGHVDDVQAEAIGDVYDALANGAAGKSLPAGMVEWINEHGPLGDEELAQAVGGTIYATVIPERHTFAMTTGVDAGNRAFYINATTLEAERTLPNFKEKLLVFNQGHFAPTADMPVSQYSTIHEMGHIVHSMVVRKGVAPEFERRLQAAFEELGGAEIAVDANLSRYAAATFKEMFAEAFTHVMAGDRSNQAAVKLVEDAWALATDTDGTAKAAFRQKWSR